MSFSQQGSLLLRRDEDIGNITFRKMNLRVFVVDVCASHFDNTCKINPSPWFVVLDPLSEVYFLSLVKVIKDGLVALFV